MYILPRLVQTLCALDTEYDIEMLKHVVLLLVALLLIF